MFCHDFLIYTCESPSCLDMTCLKLASPFIFISMYSLLCPLYIFIYLLYPSHFIYYLSFVLPSFCKPFLNSSVALPLTLSVYLYILCSALSLYLYLSALSLSLYLFINLLFCLLSVRHFLILVLLYFSLYLYIYLFFVLPSLYVFIFFALSFSSFYLSFVLPSLCTPFLFYFSFLPCLAHNSVSLRLVPSCSDLQKLPVLKAH